MRTYLCRLDELADGASRGFDAAGMSRIPMFVVRRGSQVRGWLDSCPHVDGAPLAWRNDAYLSADGSSIACYGHGALFDIESGVCFKGPCVGQALTPVAVERDEEGALWINSPRPAE
jgi:nitrite reductase/ring-hydroxylating ferredoxin subunit